MPSNRTERAELPDHVVTTVASRVAFDGVVLHGYNVSARGQIPPDIDKAVTAAHAKALAMISDHRSVGTESNNLRDELDQ